MPYIMVAFELVEEMYHGGIVGDAATPARWGRGGLALRYIAFT